MVSYCSDILYILSAIIIRSTMLPLHTMKKVRLQRVKEVQLAKIIQVEIKVFMLGYRRKTITRLIPKMA